MNESSTATTEIRSRRSRALTLGLFAIYALLLIGLILFKFPFRYDTAVVGRDLNLIPFAGSFTKDGAFRYTEVLENVAIFVPFGVYLSMLKCDWWFGKKLAPIIATAVGFEAIQYVFGIGRADITDLLDNAPGGAIGIGIYATFARVWANSANRILNIASLVLTAGALTLITGPPREYVAQSVRTLRGLDGRLRSSSVGSLLLMKTVPRF